MTSSFRFLLTATDYPKLVEEARRYAAAEFPNWDFDSNADIARFALDIYLRAQAQEIELANGWAQEGFLTSCRLRSSAVAHSVSRGYVPRNPTPATGILSVEFEPDISDRNFQPFTFQFSNRNTNPVTPQFFENAESFSIPPNTTELELEIVAGQSKSELYIGLGTPDQFFILDNTPVIDNSARITDNLSNAWMQVLDFVDSLPTDRHFTAKPNVDGTTTLTFGDNSNGISVPPSRVLTITYRIGGGSDSNATRESIQTVELSQAVIVQCINNAKLTGGQPEESLASIKKNAPASTRRKSTLSRTEEVRDFAEGYPGVSRAYVQLLGNSLIISIIPEGGGTASLSLKANLTDAINAKLIMAYQCQAVDTNFVTASISITFTTNDGFDSAELQNNIKTAILNYLNPTSFVILDQRVSFLREYGQLLRLNELRDIMQSYVKAKAIQPDFQILSPTSDLFTTAESIFTDIGSTVTATSLNIRTVTYKV